MKRMIYSLALLSLIASCQSAPEGGTAKTDEKQTAATSTEGTTYHVDNAMSTVLFMGSKPTGTHQGLLHLKDGSLQVDKGKILSGNFTIDMTKMEAKDADTNGAYKLIDHLSSADFFDVQKYGSAKFEITQCEVLSNDTSGTHRISGNLTLKDSTKNVSFPAKIKITENELSASANFNIDRTKWGLHYGNKKSLGDKFIYPEVKIILNLQAKK
jgi:polyisoprenoid-binding protein YceI